MGRKVLNTYPHFQMLSCKFCSRSFSDFNRYHNHTKGHTKWYLKHWLSNKYSTPKKPNRRKKRNDLLQDQTKRKQQWFMYTDGCVKIRSVSVDDCEEGGSALFSCKVCNRAFSAAIHLIRHERQAHNRENSTDVNPAIQADKKRFRCKFCGRTHHNKADLDYHERSHTGETVIYTCDVCQSTFKRKVYLNRHMRIHNDIRPYVCKVCGKSFIKGGGLKEHERTHTGEKPYKCPTCHRGFSGRANLRRHEMTHSGEQPFECKICNKRCNRIASLRQHMRIHTGERPYNCMHCNKAFPTCANLRRHERTHLEKKQFQCRQCGKEFTQKYTLKLHEMNHLGIRPHLCLVCGKTFMEKRKLRQHLTLVHGVAQEPEESQEASISESFGLDLALEGSKSIHLSEALKSNALPDIEGAHFKTMEDFQAYWKAAYLESDPILEPVSRETSEPNFSGHIAKPVESTSKLQAILSKLSHSADTQHPENHITEFPKQDFVTENLPHIPLIQLNQSSVGTKKNQSSPSVVQISKGDASTNLVNKPSIPTFIAKQKSSTNTNGQHQLRIPQIARKFSKENGNGALNLTKPKLGDDMKSGYAPATENQTTPDASNQDKRTHSIAKSLESSQETTSPKPLIDKDGDHDSSGTEEYSYESDKETDTLSKLQSNHHHHQSPSRFERNKQASSQNGSFIFNRFNMPGAHNCELCGQTFTSVIVLEIHMRTHKNAENQSYCIQCSKAFNNILDLEDHIRNHNNEEQNSSAAPCNVPVVQLPDHSGRSLAIPKITDDLIAARVNAQEESTLPASPEKKSKRKKVAKRRVYTCQECGKEYKKSLSLKNHMKTHEIGIVPVECVANVDNLRTYSNEEIPMLQSNQDDDVSHEPVQGFVSPNNISVPSDLITDIMEKCPTCFEEFSSKSSLAKHMQKHDEPLVITCSDAKDESDGESDTKTQWACYLCDKKFSKQERLAGHMNKHKANESGDESDTDNQWVCAICDKSFSKQVRLAGHMNKHKEYHIKVATMKEAVQEMEAVNFKGCQKRWKCPYCEKRLVKRSQLVEHLRDHIGVQPYTCKVCHKGFSKKANYISHQITHTDELKFECDTCHKKFKHSQSLKKHVVKCKKIYTCDQCNCEFRHKRSLNSHVWNAHIRVENCRCKVCGKVMSSASGLREHEMTHNGEKPYKCDICQRGFANRSNLRRHVMIHDNDRPFVCNFCNMTFNRLASLQQHERCHTGEKPYGCHHCDLFFTSKSTRRKHEKRHTKQKDIHCKFCDKVFWDRYSCRMHERVHVGDLPFECSLCNKKFPERNVLSRHMKSAHKEWYAVNMRENFRDTDSSEKGEEKGWSDEDIERRLQPLSESESEDRYHMSSDTEDEQEDGKSQNIEDVDSEGQKDNEDLELSGADEQFQERLVAQGKDGDFDEEMLEDKSEDDL